MAEVTVKFYSCSRCGKFMKQPSMTIHTKDIDWDMVNFSKWDKEIHLCEDCVKEFLNFFYNCKKVDSEVVAVHSPCGDIIGVIVDEKFTYESRYTKLQKMLNSKLDDIKEL